MPSNDLSVTIALQVPIVHGDDVLTELTLVEPSVGDLISLDDATGDIQRSMLTIVACTGLPPSVIKQIKLRDLQTIGEAAQKMMGEASRATGAKQSRGSLTSITGRRQS